MRPVMITIPRILNFPEPTPVFGRTADFPPLFPDLLSTRTFLNGFEAGLHTGTIHFPSIQTLEVDRPGSRIAAVSQRALTASTAARLLHAAFLTVLDGNRLWREKNGRPFPLLATRGEWILERYEAGTVPYDLSEWQFNDGKTVGQALGRIELSNFRGKRVEVDLLQGEVGVDVSIGYASPEAIVLQSVSVGREGQVWTNGYFFNFETEAVLGLRALLGCLRSSLSDVALRVADRIYASRQFPHEVWSGATHWKERKDGEIAIASDQTTFPLMQIIASEGGKSESIAISLSRPRRGLSRLMALAPALQETFWNLGRVYVLT
jgi:hypothetical protein